MPTRWRKLVGSFGVVGFLVAYCAAAATLADRVPRQIVTQTLFFGLVGVLWGVPLIPLIRWMNGSPRERSSPRRG